MYVDFLRQRYQPSVDLRHIIIIIILIFCDYLRPSDRNIIVNGRLAER